MKSQYVAWIIAAIAFLVVLKIHDNQVKALALLNMQAKQIETLQHHSDSALAVLADTLAYTKDELLKHDLVIDSISKLSTKTYIHTKLEVDTLRVELPDSLKSSFDSIVRDFNATIMLKDTEISNLNSKVALLTSLSSTQARSIDALKQVIDSTMIAYNKAIKALRPGLFKRVANKLPELAILAGILLVR